MFWLTRLARSGRYQLSEDQAQAILDLRLHRLTGLERDKVSLGKQILEEILKL